MKSYETERKELYEWLLAKRDECRKAEEEEKPQGYDSKANYQFQLYIHEYNEKLKVLKKKYNEDIRF